MAVNVTTRPLPATPFPMTPAKPVFRMLAAIHIASGINPTTASIAVSAQNAIWKNLRTTSGIWVRF